MIAKRQHWSGMPLLAAGLLLIALALLAASASLVLRQGESARVQGAPVPSAATWEQFSDPAGRFALRYPPAWTVQPAAQGVIVQPGGAAATEARFVVALSDNAAPADVLPDESSLPAQSVLRQAENVAVGGVIGLEAVYTFTPDEEMPATLPNDLLGAVTPRGRLPVTLIVWHAPEEASRYSVLLLDAGGGDWLPVLEQMRDSMSWAPQP